MARPIEIELSAVLDLKSVVELNMSQTGGFVLLARAAILRQVDPFSAKPSTLKSITKSTTQQWMQCHAGIMKALREALPILQEKYDKRQRSRAVKAASTRVVMGERWEKARLAKLAKENALLEAQHFVDTSHITAVLTPQKSARDRDTTYDSTERLDIVMKNRKSKTNGTGPPRLRD